MAAGVWRMGRELRINSIQVVPMGATIGESAGAVGGYAGGIRRIDNYETSGPGPFVKTAPVCGVIA